MCGTCGCGSESKGPAILKPGEEKHQHSHDEHTHEHSHEGHHHHFRKRPRSLHRIGHCSSGSQITADF